MSAVARLQPARINNVSLSPNQSSASAPTHAPHPPPRDATANQYAMHPLPAPAAANSPYQPGAGWGSSSHGSLEYGKDGDDRAFHHPAAPAAAYHQHMPAPIMPTNMDSGSHNVDVRRRQLPLYPQTQSNRPLIPATEQQRYSWDRQVHRTTGSGSGGSRQPQHTQTQQKSKKRHSIHNTQHTPRVASLITQNSSLTLLLHSLIPAPQLLSQGQAYRNLRCSTDRPSRVADETGGIQSGPTDTHAHCTAEQTTCAVESSDIC